jgi:hypothetical protein
MMSSILVSEQTDEIGKKSYGASISGFNDIESAQKDLIDAGSDEKAVAIIRLDEEDPGVAALIAVLTLAAEATTISSGEVPAENVLTEIFMAGRAWVKS